MNYTNIRSIDYNWHQEECGEDYYTYIVGRDGVKSITYHEPNNEGNPHYCDVLKTDGTTTRQFNINQVVFD